MELDDFDGAAAGAIGGLVKWYQDPHGNIGLKGYLISLVSSVAGAAVCGNFAKELMLKERPDWSHGLVIAVASLVGIGSGPVVQSIVGISSLVVSRVRLWIEYKLPVPPANGTLANPGPAGPVAVPPAVVVLGAAHVVAVPAVADGQLVSAVPANGTTPATSG